MLYAMEPVPLSPESSPTHQAERWFKQAGRKITEETMRVVKDMDEVDASRCVSDSVKPQRRC